jgi:hypothetical protein
MKKNLLVILIFYALINISYAQQILCGKTEEDNYTLLVGSIRYNNLNIEKSILQKCFKKIKLNDFFILEDIYTKEALEILLNSDKTLNLNDLKSNNRDFFSTLLLRDIKKNEKLAQYKVENNEIIDKINSVDKYNLINKKWMSNDEDYKKLLEFVANQYYSNLTIPKDSSNKSAIYYVILANKPNLLQYSYTLLNGKKSWILKDGNGLSPIHYMFSPLLKGKNVSELNDKMLKDTPTSYLINTILNLDIDKSYDYFQFAELMKENNPDLYAKLKSKYKFEIKNLNKNKEVIKLLNNKLSV